MKTNHIALLTALLACATRVGVAAEVSLESAPPVVVKTVPVAGATDVDPGLTEIKVTYSKAMMDGNWSWSTWGRENFPEMVGQPKYLADRRTCVLTVKLQPGKFYATWLNSDKFRNFKDTSGGPAVPYLLTFHTGEGRNAAVTPVIECALVTAREARIEGRGAADGRIIFRVGKDGYWSCGFLGNARFTAVLDRDGKKLRCVVKDSNGTLLLTSAMSEQGSAKFAEGRIVFLEGTRTPKSDGTITVGEFRPNTGASLPITVEVGKQVEQLLRNPDALDRRMGQPTPVETASQLAAPATPN